MSLTRDLIAFINAKEITNKDLQEASIFTLDAVATAYAGRNTEPGKVILEWSKLAGNDAGRKALIMGALTHITETDDLHRASVTHPGCVVIPAALAVGERIGASGTEILKAILRGFEAMCRIGMAVGPAHYKIWHNTATCGPFGSAMAVASLLGLDEDQTVNALGNAGTQSSGLWQFLETGAMSKHLHAGRAAEAGLIAADMAAFGFTGPPKILEGDKGLFNAMCDDPAPEKILSNLHSDWQLRKTSIKPWPSCRHTHPVIDACLEAQTKLEGENISSIEIETYQTALDVCDRPNPSSEYEAKFSLQHCASVALKRNPIDLSSFDKAAREDFKNLREITHITVAAPYADRYPKAWGAKVDIKLDSGKKITVSREHCKGDPELALSPSEMREKAMTLLSYAGIEHHAAQVICADVIKLASSNQPTTILSDFFEQGKVNV